MTKEELANRLNIDRKTLSSWGKSKPELIRLINIGLENDTLYKDFFKLFMNEDLLSMHNFYISFYLNLIKFWTDNEIESIEAALIIFLSTKKELVEIYNEEPDMLDLKKFRLPYFQKPIFNLDERLQQYIYENGKNDFQILVEDAYRANDVTKTAIAIKISILYRYSDLTKHAYRNRMRELFYTLDDKNIKEMYKFYKKMIKEDNL